MSGTRSGLGRVHPLHAFAFELSKVWEEAPAPYERLADRLEIPQQRVEDFFDGSATPSPVELALLLYALHPYVTIPEIAAWQTCLKFAQALATATRYDGDPIKEFLQILRPLEEEDARKRPPVLSGFTRLPHEWSGLPTHALLSRFLSTVFTEEWRRAPWMRAHSFARELQAADAREREVDDPGNTARSWATELGSFQPGMRAAQSEIAYSDEAMKQQQAAQQLPPSTTPLTIFISDERKHATVESAVSEWLDVQGREIAYEGTPILGSWWKTLLTRLKKEAEDHLDDGISLTGRVAGLYGLDTRQAEVNQKEAEAFAKVMEALADVDSAIIHHGTLLVVKHAGTVVRRELSQLEVEALRRNPILTTRPDIILTELQRHTQELATTDEARALPSQHNVG
ncbi:hypothetical protein ABZ912_32205 [Nonomuraea angiospora]|uniref:hypothetical protein n=1 Tax=Nonomuraea angiospora TaxID=46172 RepID=UPI0033F61850